MSRKEGNPKHGQRYTKAYSAWANMKQRCENTAIPGYKNYGGRGIGYDPAWFSFENFLADMGQPPTGMMLERNDNNKDYCKLNCRWATRKEQNNNRRVRCTSQSGVADVSYEWAAKRWRARCLENGKRRILYSGDNFFEAVCARKSWENQNG